LGGWLASLHPCGYLESPSVLHEKVYHCGARFSFPKDPDLSLSRGPVWSPNSPGFALRPTSWLRLAVINRLYSGMRSRHPSLINRFTVPRPSVWFLASAGPSPSSKARICGQRLTADSHHSPGPFYAATNPAVSHRGSDMHGSAVSRPSGGSLQCSKAQSLSPLPSGGSTLDLKARSVVPRADLIHQLGPQPKMEFSDRTILQYA
jgi:hypothetical protein